MIHLCTVDEARKILGIKSRTTLKKRISEGLPCVRIGGRLFFIYGDIVNYIQEHRLHKRKYL